MTSEERYSQARMSENDRRFNDAERKRRNTNSSRQSKTVIGTDSRSLSDKDALHQSSGTTPDQIMPWQDVSPAGFHRMTSGNQPQQQRKMMTLHDKLIHAVTEFDRKQSTKRGYNIYALPQMIGRVQEVSADIAAGADVRKAITAAFTGRLMDVCLKTAGLDKSTIEEARGHGEWYYQPVALKQPGRE